MCVAGHGGESTKEGDGVTQAVVVILQGAWTGDRQDHTPKPPSGGSLLVGW